MATTKIAHHNKPASNRFLIPFSDRLSLSVPKGNLEIEDR